MPTPRRRRGGNDGGKNKRKKGGRSPEMREARRDVMLSVKPARREIRRARKQGIRDYQQAANKTENIYGALAQQLQPLAGQFQNQSNQVASGLQGNLAQLAGTIGSTVPGVPQSELSAGAGMFGALGGGALAELASGQQRNLAYQNATRGQAAVEGTHAQRNMLMDLTDFKKDLTQQRVDLMRDVPALIRQRKDFLSDQEFEQMLALQQLQLERQNSNRSYGLQSRSLSMQQQADALMQQYLADKLRLMGGR
jgi:Sec-independent protein translocase protein TatA